MEIVTARDLRIEALKPIRTQVGGAGGPRLVTAAFKLSPTHWRRRGLPDVQIAADLDTSIFRDEFSIRRRAARAVVPVGLRVAKRLIAGKITPTIERSPATSPYIRVSFFETELFEGLERRATGYFDIRRDPEDGEPDADPDFAKRLGSALKDLAESLHTAIDDPVNRGVFGPP